MWGIFCTFWGAVFWDSFIGVCDGVSLSFHLSEKSRSLCFHLARIEDFSFLSFTDSPRSGLCSCPEALGGVCSGPPSITCIHFTSHPSFCWIAAFVRSTQMHLVVGTESGCVTAQCVCVGGVSLSHQLMSVDVCWLWPLCCPEFWFLPLSLWAEISDPGNFGVQVGTVAE